MSLLLEAKITPTAIIKKKYYPCLVAHTDFLSWYITSNQMVNSDVHPCSKQVGARLVSKLCDYMVYIAVTVM